MWFDSDGMKFNDQGLQERIVAIKSRRSIFKSPTYDKRDVVRLNKGSVV